MGTLPETNSLPLKIGTWKAIRRPFGMIQGQDVRFLGFFLRLAKGTCWQ